MNTGGIWLFGKPDEIFIQDDVLYRRVYETEQVYRDERIMTKDEFLMCMKEWYKGDNNE